MIMSLMPIMKQYVPTDAFHQVNKKIMFVVLIGILIGILFGLIASILIIRPITTLNKSITNLAKLDFRATGTEQKLANRKDETGEMARSVFAIREALITLTNQLKEESDFLNEAADGLNINTNETGVVVEQVETMDAVRDIIDEQSANVEKTGTGFSDVKTGIDHSIASVNMISKSMDKLDDARVKVVDIVQSLTAIADENATSTQETLASVAEVTTSISNISDQATSLKEVADKLDKSIKCQSEIFRRRKIRIP